jgi:hypothetical protein
VHAIQAQPLTTFLSYAHHNQRQRKKLKLYLSQLESDGLIRLWDDRELRVGQFVDESIQTKMDESEVFVLLVSQEFLASDYCSSIEMTRALERHRAGTALVFPIIVAPCDWEHTLLAKLVVAPTDGKAIARWKPQSAGWADVARLLREAIARFREKRAAQAPPRQEEGGDSFPPLVLQHQEPPAPQSGPGWWWIAGGVGLAITLGVVLVQQFTHPELKSSSVESTSAPPPVTPGTAKPGSFNPSVNHPDQPPPPPAVKAPLALIELSVQCDPVALIKVVRNGKVRASGMSPLVTHLPPGEVEIEVSSTQPSFMKIERITLMATSKHQSHTVVVQQGTAMIRSFPPAHVLIDGVPAGDVPLKMPLYEGMHTVRFQCDSSVPKCSGVPDATQAVTIIAGKTTEVVQRWP